MSGRCKCCDNKLKDSEIIWRRQTHQHEELCWTCRQTLFGADDEDVPVEGLIYIEDLSEFN